jgi:DNA-binding NarL/FixJ family response regulator
MTKLDEKETGCLKILVVDDHDAIRKSIIKCIVKSFKKDQIIEAGTGEDAVVLSREEKPDLVIMDVKLPGINGIIAAGQIRKILPGVKIVVLTIYDTPAFQSGALDAGADAFLSKNDIYIKLVPTIQGLMAE